MKRRAAHGSFVAALSLAAAVLTAVLFWANAYAGFVQTSWAEIRLTPWREGLTNYRFFEYWADYYSRLAFDQRIQLFTIPVAGASDSELRKGLNRFHRGDVSLAIERLESSIDQEGVSEEKLFWLAVAYMRWAEEQNCLSPLTGPDGAAYSHVADPSRMCSLPLSVHHRRTRGAQQAVRLLERLLSDYDTENAVYRWLLNFNHMTLGGFPQDVPALHRIQTGMVRQFYGPIAKKTVERHANLVFRERARDLGVNTLDAGKGVAVEDFDGDGHLDIITGGTFDPIRYYRNEAGLAFQDVTQGSGLDGASQAHIISAADYDNDGLVDLFVARPFHHFQLFRNRGGTFQDVTISSGLLRQTPTAEIATYACIPAFGDIDNDGDLDLMLAQFGQRTPWSEGLLSREPMESKLFLNEAGRFTDRTAEFGLAQLVRDQIFLSASFGDYDRDGWTDLFLSSFTRGRSVLLRNLDGRHFEPTSHLSPNVAGFASAFLDINHDGQLDVFQAASSPAATATEYWIEGLVPDRNASSIIVQNDGVFESRPDFFKGGGVAGVMGVSFGDLNNDGCYDFYFGTGNPEPWYVLPNMMFLGDRNSRDCLGTMTNISVTNGFGNVQKGHGIVFFDFDNDGDQNVYSSLGGMWPADRWPNQFFVNDSSLDNHWVKIRLRGRKSNFFGVGSSIRVVAESAAGERVVRTYLMNNGTGFGSSPYLAHIGLLDANRALEVEVYWPASGCRKSYAATLDELNVLDESECFGGGR